VKTIGQIIREKRKARGWTLEQLAAEIGRTFSTVAAWERDEITPTLFIVWDLADIFNCSLDEICGRNFEGDNNGSKTKN
jgi:transcriptional regulator with XRE-family HTH domain